MISCDPVIVLIACLISFFGLWPDWPAKGLVFPRFRGSEARHGPRVDDVDIDRGAATGVEAVTCPVTSQPDSATFGRGFKAHRRT